MIKPDGHDGRTKAGKAWMAEAEETGKPVISAQDAGRVEQMVREVLAQRIFGDGGATLGDVLEAGGAEYERSHYATDTETGLLVKVRPDVEIQRLAVIIDWKTTDDARPHSFERKFFSLGYDLSAAMYMEYAKGEYNTFIWLAVERDDPHGVRAYYMERGDDVHERAIKRLRRALDLYAACTAKKTWPGYSAEPHHVELPRWMRDGEEG